MSTRPPLTKQKNLFKTRTSDCGGSCRPLPQSVFLPRSPIESFDKRNSNRATDTEVAAHADSTDEFISLPLGIMFALFGAVKQFLPLLSLFSL